MKKIKNIRFKENLTIPGVAGDLGKVLPSQSKTIKDLAMYSLPECYLVRINGHEMEISRELVLYAEVDPANAEITEPASTAPTNTAIPTQTIPMSTVVFNTKVS